MTNTYNASRALSGVEPIFHHGGAIGVYSTWAITSSTLAAGDKINLLTIPRFAVLLDVIVAADKLDTGGTAALAFIVGDTGSTARFISAVTQGLTVPINPTHMNVASGLGYQTSIDNNVILQITGAANVQNSTGNVYFVALYSMEAITATIEGQETP